LSKGATQERLETVEHGGVEVVQRWCVKSVRHDARRVDKFAERGTVPEEKKRDLRIRDFPNGFEEGLSFVNPLLSVLVAETLCPYWSPQQLEITIAAVNDIGRKQAGVETCLVPSGRDDLTLVGVEGQTDPTRSLPKVVESL